TLPALGASVSIPKNHAIVWRSQPRHDLLAGRAEANRIDSAAPVIHLPDEFARAAVPASNESCGITGNDDAAVGAERCGFDLDCEARVRSMLHRLAMRLARRGV